MEEIFTFDDIVYLEDEMIKKVLGEIDTTELSRALKLANEASINKIYKQISKRAAAMLKEDMEFMGPIRFNVAEESQEAFIKILFDNFAVDNKISVDTDDKKVDFLLDYPKIPAVTRDPYKVYSGKDKFGNDFETSFSDIKIMNSRTRRKVLSKFTAYELTLAAESCPFSNLVKPHLTDRTRSKVYQKFETSIHDGNLNELSNLMQEKIGEKIYQMILDGEINAPRIFSLDDSERISDRDVQVILREIPESTEEKIQDFENLCKEYDNLLDKDKYPKDFYFSEEEIAGGLPASRFIEPILAGMYDFDNELNIFVGTLSDEALETKIMNWLDESAEKYHQSTEFLKTLLRDYEKLINSWCLARGYLIAAALYNCCSSVVDKYLRNMSKRCAKPIRIALEKISPTEEEIFECQKMFLDIINRASASGEIIINNDDNEIVE